MQNKYYAAADCGTNSFHLIIAEVNDDGSFGIAAREKEIIRLGNSNNDIIPADAITRSIKTLQHFKETAESFNAPLVVVATSAVRNAQNKGEFLSKVYQMTGISVRVLTGIEEAKLTFSGVTKAIGFDNNVLCIDIGGGSTEFIVGKERDILFTKSLDLGAVRLSHMYFNDDYSYSKEQIDKCYKFAVSEINKIKAELLKYDFEKVIGASGTIISAASMVTGGREDLNKFILRRDELKSIADKVFKYKTVEERKALAGLEPARADIITAGIIILMAIFDVLGIEKMTISLFGLREGVIVESFLSNY